MSSKHFCWEEKNWKMRGFLLKQRASLKGFLSSAAQVLDRFFSFSFFSFFSYLATVEKGRLRTEKFYYFRGCLGARSGANLNFIF